MSHRNRLRSHGVSAAHLHRVRDLLIVIVIDFLEEIFTELGGGQKSTLGRRESDRYRAQITAGRARRSANALMSSGNICFEIRNISVATELLNMSFTLDRLR